MKAKPTPKLPAAFERSGKDKEPRGMKEGSAKEEAYDRRQMKALAPKKRKP